MTRAAARARDRLARRGLDAGVATTTAAHPNARFTTPAAQCPSIAPEWEDPKGVPIDAFLFGGRRATVVPLVTEAFDWEHGVFMGSIMGSEKTAAARPATVGAAALRPDGDAAVLRLPHGRLLRATGSRSAAARARSCRRSSWSTGSARTTSGRFLWPGFGENSRVLAWVFERCDDAGGAQETPIGRVPAEGALDTEGLDIAPEEVAKLLDVDPEEWRRSCRACASTSRSSATSCPRSSRAQLEALEQRLNASS